MTLSTFSQKNLQWRGKNRTGVYDETGLLKKWPEKGPELKWSVDSLPKGYSSVAIANNTLYITGIEGKQDVLMAYDMNGNEKWRLNYGRAWTKSFTHSRATPTIEDNRLYLSSGMGDIACVNSNTGKMIWSKTSHEDFEAPYGIWGISESLLLVDDIVVYTPAGDKTTIVAYNKMNGELVWMSKSLKDKPSYTSPLLIDRGGKKVILNVTELYIIGVDAASGRIMWQYDFGKLAGGSWKANIHTNTPIYKDGEIFITSGYDHKSIMLTLAEDGESVKEKWVTDVLDVHHGGVVLVDNHIYGANWINNNKGNWVCLDWETGKVKYETKWQNKGSIISAEGMLYCYEEKRGHIALVKANPEKFEVISSFRVPLGKGPHWSHLVIKDKTLYVRHASALMAYNIAE